MIRTAVAAAARRDKRRTAGSLAQMWLRCSDQKYSEVNPDLHGGSDEPPATMRLTLLMRFSGCQYSDRKRFFSGGRHPIDMPRGPDQTVVH
ncbi:hypothetical protein GCM10010211_70240 [Streptomyces albospinus]|uniref:Uncharacterized protein n=1 Tax=Streptomyces albospinus TaxID=285515 RepID=A0ABQ2VKW2_9ACTN|nr:hypothetical protein GCM10010211_70240 [Streptomyces albospinus]